MNRLQFRILFREFLFRVVDLELLAPQGDISKLLGQFAALLLFVSLWVLAPSVFLAAGTSDPESDIVLVWVEAHFLVSTTMMVVGLFAVLSWESMFVDRRDVLVLSPLPVLGRTLFSAKVAAVATALGLTVVALNIFPGLLAPFVFANAPTAPSPKYDAAMPPLSPDELQSVLDNDLVPARANNGALTSEPHVGLSIGVLKHGTKRVFAYGTASPDSIFEIGSVTKTFTALLLSQMVQQGKVRLDEPLRDLLPAGTVSRPAGPEIRLLDLATHRSGLPSWPDNLTPANPANYHVADLYGYIAKRGVAKPRNTHSRYSNLGFGLLGQALANRGGVPYPDLVRREITEPFGMIDTAVKLSSEQDSRFIQGYNARHHPAGPLRLDALAGAGAIRSTAGDMLTYLDAQLHPEQFPALSAALIQSHRLRGDAGPDSRIALAWIYDPRAETYWHNGETQGYSSYAFFRPKGDYAAVVLMNTAPNAFGLTGQLATHIRQRLAGEPAISLVNPVVSGYPGVLSFIRSFAAYWIAMFAAGTFIFSAMLTVQGFAQLLPRQWFLRLSAVLQLTFFCLLLVAYFLQPAFSSVETLQDDQEWLFWVPSYWFFALFQQLNGPIPPQLAVLARRAWIGVALTVCGAGLAYLICYFRTLRKVAEQPDILPSPGRRLHWLPQFGGALATAVVRFSIRTLLRSRHHRVILTFYLGLAFGIAMFFGKSPELQVSGIDPWHHANTTMLVTSIVLMTAAILGARIVFSMPLDLRANWIFRIAPIRGGTDCLKAVRRSLYVISILPVWTVFAIVLLAMWPWREAASHLLLLLLLGTFLAEICLYSFRKIPFTCSYLPGRTYAHMALASFLGFLILVGRGNALERSLAKLSSSMIAIVALGAAAVCAERRTTAKANSAEAAIQFEEIPDPAILPLGLNRDGVV